MEKLRGHGVPRLKEPSSTSRNAFLSLASVCDAAPNEGSRGESGQSDLARGVGRVFVGILVDARTNARSMNQSVLHDVDETGFAGWCGGAGFRGGGVEGSIDAPLAYGNSSALRVRGM